jgi:hypothetical protein
MMKPRKMRRVGHVGRIREKTNACRILAGKPERKIPLGRPRCNWVDNIKMDFTEVRLGGIDSFDLAEDRDQWRALVNMIVNLQIP